MPVTVNGSSNPAFRREHNNAPEGHNQTTSIAGGRDWNYDGVQIQKEISGKSGVL